jgi:molecular chaperone HtpG
LLQQNPEITAMRNALTRRVLDMLKKLAGKKDEYQKFWNEFGPVFKEGLVEDHANKDKLARLLRFATTHTSSETQDQSLDDYLGRCQEDQSKIYYILAENHATAIASPHLEQLQSRGIEVLLLTDRIDAWVAEALAEYEGKALVDVAREALDMPEQGDQKDQDKLNEKHRALLDRIQEVLSSRVTAVNVSRRLVNSPACVVASDHDLNPQVRRMLEASGQALPESKPILEINIEHPLVTRLSKETDVRRFGALSEIVLDHALLAEGSPLPNPAEYVQRMNDYLLNAEHGADSEPS